MIRSETRLVAVVLALWCAAPRTGAAQTGIGQGNPFGRRGQPPGGGAPGQLMSALTITLDSGVDDTTHARSVNDTAFSDGVLLDGTAAGNDPQFRGVHVFSSALAQLSLSKFGHGSGWQVTGGSSVRYYPGLRNVVRARDNVSGAVAFPLGARIQIRARGIVAYSPYFSLAGASTPVDQAAGPSIDDLSVQAAPPDVQTLPTSVDSSILRRTAYSSATRSTFNYRVAQHSTLSLEGGTQRTDFVSSTDPSLASWDARFRFQHQIAQRTAVYVGYGRRVARFSTLGDRAQIEDIDVGVDHSRAWSLTRNTTLRAAPGVMVTKDGGSRRYGAKAAVALDHLLPTGRIGLRYDRQVGLVGGLVRPLFMDTISANYYAALGRRVSIFAMAGYVLGQVGLNSATANGYRSYNGQVRLSVAATSWAWLHADYFAYQHLIGSDVQLLGSITGNDRRQSVQIGLTMRVPLLTGRP